MATTAPTRRRGSMFSANHFGSLPARAAWAPDIGLPIRLAALSHTDVRRGPYASEVAFRFPTPLCPTIRPRSPLETRSLLLTSQFSEAGILGISDYKPVTSEVAQLG